MSIYVESDFFLALIKSEDWLKKSAIKFEKENRGSLATSVIAVAETFLAGKKYNLDVEHIAGSISEIASIEGITTEEAMEIAYLIKHEGTGVFDSFHAVLSRGRVIASSEKVYDRLGKKRIPLEK